MVFAIEGQCGQHTRENVSVTEHAESPESAAGPRRIPSATVRDQRRHRCMECTMTALPGNASSGYFSTGIAPGGNSRREVPTWGTYLLT